MTAEERARRILDITASENILADLRAITYEIQQVEEQAIRWTLGQTVPHTAKISSSVEQTIAAYRKEQEVGSKSQQKEKPP